MFNKITLHSRRPTAFVALLAVVMLGLLTVLTLLGVPAASASHNSPGDAPGKVTGVAASENQEVSGSIDVTWEATTPGTSPITDYIVFVVNAADETDNRTETVTTSGPNPSPEELACSVAGLSGGATYDVKVRARNLIGEQGPWSDTVQVTLDGN